MKILGNKYKFTIDVPPNISIEYLYDKVRFKGPKDEISRLAEELRKLNQLQDGQLVKLDKLTLKVSDYITIDQDKKNWIELPADAWGIMASKFQDVVIQYETNPFDFNSCGYTNKIPYDIEIEITDLPIKDVLIYYWPHLDLMVEDNGITYLSSDSKEILDFVKDYLIKNKIDLDYEKVSEDQKEYRIYFREDLDSEKLFNALKQLEGEELKRKIK